MKFFLRRPLTKASIVALLIAGIVLLCPVSPTTSAATSCDTNTMTGLSHNTNASGANADCSKTHPEPGSHVASPLTVFDYSALLFFAALTILTFFPYKSLMAASQTYLTKLNYFWHRYREIIKPKLESLFLRWLNLLGGTIAFSS